MSNKKLLPIALAIAVIAGCTSTMTKKEAKNMNTKTKQILMVVANPAVSTVTGWPVGFWAAELFHAYDAFKKQGYQITVASPDGGEVKMDAYSDPRDASGYSKDDQLSLQYLNDPKTASLLKNTVKVDTLDPEHFDAIVVVGGQAPMFTFKDATGLQNIFTKFYEEGKTSAALCHGTALLLYLKDKSGQPFVKGKTMTGFADSEEDYIDKTMNQKVMPFRIEDEAKKMGANFEVAGAFQPFAVQDGNLITGQQQNSGHAVAEKVIAALEK